MQTALLFALAASSALILGGVIGAYWQAPKRLVAAVLAFASGALVAALAFELFEEAFSTGGVAPAAGGFLLGAATFVGIDTLLERLTARTDGGATGFALLAGVTLDGVPENLALGIALIGGSGRVALRCSPRSSPRISPRRSAGRSTCGSKGAHGRSRSGFGRSPPCCSPPLSSSGTPSSAVSARQRGRSCSPSRAGRCWPRWRTR
ncbi:MAG: hypothetical protein AVDCRST_MAG18-894 [uncultured Thermomicrobiales bacterium]|uniref:Zinc transporter, ZIP family n=1 Tax=uncultured Thermomicrobiales bacterium TaxID=1645740 RepID=A0A6J4USQ2_9BACT|nr:MAG: hypothetical protein AVDCRST_MAG18-894 [uncultured Thermomicrobiales bacterium]